MTVPARPEELRAWIREYTPRLLVVARAFATAETDAEDILQEVWWRAYARAHARGKDAPLVAWLVTLTVNVGRDHLRRERRRRMLWAWWGGEAPTHVEPQPPHHPDTLVWREVAALPRLQREVLILRIIDDRSTAECAAILGRAEGTVKASLARALVRLRTRIPQESTWTPSTIPAITK